MLSVKIYRNLRRNFYYFYILINFMLYARGNFKNVTIYIWQYIHILHRYSVCGAFQLRGKNPTFTWRTSTHDNWVNRDVLLQMVPKFRNFVHLEEIAYLIFTCFMSIFFFFFCFLVKLGCNKTGAGWKPCGLTVVVSCCAILLLF